mmetsp:Transcript_67809/g.126670  ORF Transcript_67809/g.126670 Transcript_67809/m.126670 type:complete len:410 (-) Transcript_67809:114-1343(-)
MATIVETGSAPNALGTVDLPASPMEDDSLSPGGGDNSPSNGGGAARLDPIHLGVPIDADATAEEVLEKPSELVEQKGQDCETRSLKSTASELECPICYHILCEPVRAGCNRHIFCRQCLWRMQRTTEPIKCPICRALGPYDVTILAEVTELTPKLKSKDPTYDERAKSAALDRQLARALWQERAASHRSRQDEVRQFEVCGAGCEESNGVYVMDVMQTYCGPATYRKPNTHFWIYRWNRTHWVIAELRQLSWMGNERSWMYTAPTQLPTPLLPPAGGWEVSRRSRALPPAPEVREVRPSNHIPSGHAPSTSVPSVIRSERAPVIIAPLQSNVSFAGLHESSTSTPPVATISSLSAGPSLAQMAAPTRPVPVQVESPGNSRTVPASPQAGVDSTPVPVRCYRCTPGCHVQ